MSELDRTLAWEGCVNVRDLGGLPAGDGRTTRRGALVRADSIHGLTDAGWEALVAAGVRTVVDLRRPQERANDPPRALPFAVVRVPVEGSAPTEIRRGRGASTAAYLEMLDRERSSFARAVRAVAEAPAGAIVVHCAAGKDRTGVLVALLLRIAGVPRAVVAEDYGLSEANVVEAWRGWIAKGADEPERMRRRALLASPPATIAGVLEEVEGRPGGIPGHLRVDGAVLGAVRRRLVG